MRVVSRTRRTKWSGVDEQEYIEESGGEEEEVEFRSHTIDR